VAGADFEHSAALADIATRLPHLRHRVVLGEHVRTGEVDFALHFEHMPWEKRHGISLDNWPGRSSHDRRVQRAVRRAI
jgi:cyclohexanecarboxylate-CoA ligase